jgi:hypothetical protein
MRVSFIILNSFQNLKTPFKTSSVNVLRTRSFVTPSLISETMNMLAKDG